MKLLEKAAQDVLRLIIRAYGSHDYRKTVCVRKRGMRPQLTLPSPPGSSV